jgi:hypothetical protein
MIEQLVQEPVDTLGHHIRCLTLSSQAGNVLTKLLSLGVTLSLARS